MKTLAAIVLVGCLTPLLVRAVDTAASDKSLFEAIRAGDSHAVQKLLKAGVDLKARNDIGDTPLMAAALYADAGVLDLLLKAGADVNANNKAGATALMRAATFEDKVRLLVSKGADVKARSAFGNTALILAARKAGNRGAVKILLDKGADANAKNAFGVTPLISAAAAGDLDCLRLLLDAGADVNAQPKMDENGFIWGGGRSALMWAAFQGDKNLVRFLLERGAKVNDANLAGSALAQASWTGHSDVAQLLLDAGAKVDQRDLFANYTPLHWAASSERSSPALVELLLARGADVNAEGGQSIDNYLGVAQTPLMLARRRGDTPIARALLKAGAKETGTQARKAAESPLLGAKTPAEAIQRALPMLTKTAEETVPTFLRHASKQDCLSCHQQQLPLAALSLAGSRKFTIDRDVTRHQLGLLKRFNSTLSILPPDDRLSGTEAALQTTLHPEPAISDGYTAMDFVLQREPASMVTDTLVHRLATIQHADGHWSYNLPRPPIQASDITATALGLYTIKTFPIPSRGKELESRVDRARAWLAKTSAETNEERVHQLLGLAWAGERPDVLKKLTEELIGKQRPDGGWGQLAGLPSDAYATGQSLYTLLEGTKIPASDPAVRRGIDYLLRTQLADGTWHVRTRSHPFQPPMDSSFPHGRDGWISATGTSWAVMALATSLDASQTAPAVPALTKAATPAPGGVKTTGPVEFARDIKPILERSCIACHSGEKSKGGYDMTNRASLLKGGNRGELAVVPGNPEAGHLIRLVQDQVEDLEMPPLATRGRYPRLTEDEIAKLRAWIASGANWPTRVNLQPASK